MTPILGIMASQISGHLWAPEGAYDALATVTLSASTASVSFTGIPSGYKHLQLRGITLSSSASSDILTRFNGDSNSNYSKHVIYADGSTPAIYGSGNTNHSFTGFTGSSSIPAPFILDILDYSNLNKYKTNRAISGDDLNGSGYITFGSGAWRNYDAIISMTITHAGSVDFAQYTQFALYGVK